MYYRYYYNPWFTPALHTLKSQCRRLRRIWSSSHSAADLLKLRSTTNLYHASILKSKRHYYHSQLVSSKSSPRSLWNIINKILLRHSDKTLPSTDNPSTLSNSFATFFSDKINKLRNYLQSNPSVLSPHNTPPFSPAPLSKFTPATTDEIAKLISA